MSLDKAVAPLLSALTQLPTAQRHLHPIHLEQVKLEIDDVRGPLKQAYKNFSETGDAIKAGIRTSMGLVLKAMAAFEEVPSDPEGIFHAYRAFRYMPYALENLYPANTVSPAINLFFLENFRHNDAKILKGLKDRGPDTGIKHFNNERGSKGGYSLYVPEFYDAAKQYPVVVALHGGSGHGRGFLWTWLKEARSRELILISPTARGDTWALMDPTIDSDNLCTILETVRARWSIDENRLLMTGMSDGGTFTYVSGLQSSSPFTHLAPISASFHPMMLELIDAPNIVGRPIYVTHGTNDWMFDIEVARMARETLGGRGADVVFREIADLAHTYPREENPRILDWFTNDRSRRHT